MKLIDTKIRPLPDRGGATVPFALVELELTELDQLRVYLGIAVAGGGDVSLIREILRLYDELQSIARAARRKINSPVSSIQT